MPKLDVTINLDGSLNLELIYDGETTTFNSRIPFTVNYSSAPSGVNFRRIFNLETAKIQAGVDLMLPLMQVVPN